MKFNFKIQPYQIDTDETIVCVFSGQPHYDKISYIRDGGMSSDSVMTNFDQIFATISPTTVRTVP